MITLLLSWNSFILQESLQILSLIKAELFHILTNVAHVVTRVFTDDILKRDIKKSISEEQILFFLTYPDLD